MALEKAFLVFLVFWGVVLCGAGATATFLTFSLAWNGARRLGADAES